MNTTELYTQWLEKATADPDLQAELQAIAGQDEEIRDRFYRSLEFGTAGLRGVIGAGTNRMNVYTVGRATQGLADYLNAKYDHPSVAIGYDSRIKSDLFSKEAAAVLAGNGIKVYLYKELEPTPCLSFAVRQLGAQSGIILTASHNPAKYNGYKCYNKNGYQMTDDEAAETYHYIEKVDYFTGIQKANFDTAVADGTVEYIGEKMMTAFLDAVETQCMNRGVCQKADQRTYGGRAGTAGPKRSAHFPDGSGCRCPSGGTGKEKVRHGAAEKPAQGRTQKDSAKKECGKGDLIWETLLLRK